MIVVDILNPEGGISARFCVFAAAISETAAEAQLAHLREIAPEVGMKFCFLVTPDLARGWRTRDGAPILGIPTVDLLAAYADGDAAKIRDVGSGYLAALIGAWIADLQYRWRTRGPVPIAGEAEMREAGVLGILRSAAESQIREI